MKDFQIQLDSPSQGYYIPGMKVTGTLLISNDKCEDFKAIEVSIFGFSNVHWSQERGSGENRRTEDYRSHENYLKESVCVWSKETSAAGGQFPAGSYQYPFSFNLVGDNLPSSYEGRFGHIKYKVEARVKKDALLKLDNVCETVIKVVNVVESNRPDLLEPKSMEVRKTLCCLCCASGPIVIRVSVPRTIYRIQQDCIPVEVSVENGSSRAVREVVAVIRMLLRFSAQGNYRHDYLDVVTVRGESVPAHSTRVFQLPPLEVQDRPVTSTQSRSVQVNYVLRVEAALPRAVNPIVNIPLVLGVEPLPETESIFSPQTHGAEPHPHQGFQPPHLMPHAY